MTNILLINKENCALKLVDEIIRETGNVRESLEEYYQFLKTQRRIMGLYVADFFYYLAEGSIYGKLYRRQNACFIHHCSI